MKLTWSEIEAHREATTADQWRRMQAYFRDGMSVMQIASAEAGGKEVLRAKTSVVLAIGRGSIAVLNSMLQRPVRVPAEKGQPTKPSIGEDDSTAIPACAPLPSTGASNNEAQ